MVEELGLTKGVLDGSGTCGLGHIKRGTWRNHSGRKQQSERSSVPNRGPWQPSTKAAVGFEGGAREQNPNKEDIRRPRHGGEWRSWWCGVVDVYYTTFFL